MKVPCGIAIPWYADGAIWGIKVRPAAGDQRYQQVSGGNIRGWLYFADQVEPGLPLFLTEGEFDALITQQVGKGRLSAVSIGSASNRHIDPRWFVKLMATPRTFICMDADAAGTKAGAEIVAISNAMSIVHVPVGKDMNEFYLCAGEEVLDQWIIKNFLRV